MSNDQFKQGWGLGFGNKRVRGVEGLSGLSSASVSSVSSGGEIHWLGAWGWLGPRAAVPVSGGRTRVLVLEKSSFQPEYDKSATFFIEKSWKMLVCMKSRVVISVLKVDLGLG